MKPINLQGHSRPIKKVKFNDNGDILFTASSDRTIVSWSIPSGEKLKTFNHSAAINTFCVTNKHLISGDNTGTIYIWEISTGKILKKLEHDPTLSVRSLDFLHSDPSQFMVVYAGRAKLAKSFISIYNINDILNYGENRTEDKSASLIDITSEVLKDMNKLSLPDENKNENKEGDTANVQKANTNTQIDSNASTNLSNLNSTTNTTNTTTTKTLNINSSTFTRANTNAYNNANTNTTNSNSLKSFADNLIATNTTNNNNISNNTIVRGANINEFNNTKISEPEQKFTPKPAFKVGGSIYDEENSIYAIYAKAPAANTTQNSNYKFANSNQNQNNFNGNMNNNNYGGQQQQINQGYNFNNNNNGSIYNQNQQMNAQQFSDVDYKPQSGNYRFNNNNNNFNNNNNNNFCRNNLNNNGSLYTTNNSSLYNNNNQLQQNQNSGNVNSTGGFQRAGFQNTNNLFNPLKGNNFDPNPSIIQRQTADTSKISVSYEKIIPMKQIEIPNSANTKYVAAKFFSYNKTLCIAVTKENGSFEFINYVSSKTIHEANLHTEIIFDFDFEDSENLFLTVSKDGTACVYDFDKYKIIKTFKPENPVRFLNACKIHKLDKNFEETVKDIKYGVRKNSNLETTTSNLNSENVEVDNHLNGNGESNENLNSLDKFVFVIAGGQDSKLVTTTKEGGFEIIGFNMEMEDSIFMHLANFGPVNTLDISKKNNFFASGSEDSSVKLLSFDSLISGGNGTEKK